MEMASGASDAGSFAGLLERLRGGDARAAEELVRRYEPEVRLEVRMRIVDPRLRRAFDSMDVCQSVLASFFVRAAAGQFDLEGADDLVRLLVTMARNKVAIRARARKAGRRDHRREVPRDGIGRDLADSGQTPSRIVAGRDLLEEFRRRLTPEERRLADLRGQGHGWAEIAQALGGTPQARRKQLARAAARVASELGLEGAGDDPLQ
jgi:RNA polymerase sigma-70 factor (ECF subfamily)